VADEVRLLALRTQQSTTEIQGMIETLQSNSEAAVKVIDESSQGSQLTIEQANLASRSLDQISQSLRNLTSLNASIASATLQQSHAVEDINRNVTQAAGLAQDNAQACERTSAASQPALAAVGWPTESSTGPIPGLSSVSSYRPILYWAFVGANDGAEKGAGAFEDGVAAMPARKIRSGSAQHQSTAIQRGGKTVGAGRVERV
jgi:ABC-type transporter Mla subunit MlaD